MSDYFIAVGVENVINFDCPPKVDSYIHRVGRYNTPLTALALTTRALPHYDVMELLKPYDAGSTLSDLLKGTGKLLIRIGSPASCIACKHNLKDFTYVELIRLLWVN